MKVHACLMTQNELLDLSTNLTRLLHYVDSVTIVDGGSTDGTISYMRNFSRVDNRVRFFIHPWKDNFPAQRNNYLARVGEIAADGDWVLACDPDEFFDEAALLSLHRIADVVPKKVERFSAASFRCRSVSLRGTDRVWSNEDDYWKPLYFRWHRGLRYTHDGEGAVHERLEGIGLVYQTGKHPEFPALFYEHRKQENVIWPRGARNLFIGGGGPNMGSKNPRWVELRAIADRLGLRTWRDFHAYLLAGNIDSALRGWIIRHRNENGYDGASEHREVYKTYFRLYHPEEEPSELQGEAIP